MSGAIQWPLVVERLLELLPTLDGWDAVTIYDGPDANLGDAPLFCSVGLTVPFDGIDDRAGGFSWQQSEDGFETREVGTVHCQLTATTGDAAAAAMRVVVFALASAFTSYVAANRTLGGVLSAEGTSSLAVNVISRLDGGSDQTLVFTLQYTTVT